jgi:L-rhamnose-H+ transport protein
MTPDPALGVFFHWLGGLASASFYVPYRKVKQWSWETYWLAGGVFSWIIAPWLIAFFWTKDLLAVLRAASLHDLFWPFFFGLLWGVGGLTFGLTMRYLGLSLGMAIALGLCAAFGTLMPPLFTGEFASKVLGTTSGRVILIGVAVCLAGIAVAGMAGVAKERAISPAQSRAVIREFNLRKGIAVATLAGIMSACFAYGLAAGDPIRSLTLARGTRELWQGLPVLVVVLVGGFTTNFVWSVFLNIRNHSGHEYLAARAGKYSVPLANNYLFCALAGCTWYMQFFFYTMGETQMGIYKFSSWTLHMASIIIFSSLWGLGLKEWRGAGALALRLLFVSLLLLVLSTVIVGYGNYLGTRVQ